MKIPLSLLPIKGVPEAEVRNLAADLAALGLEAAVLPPAAAPRSACDPHRSQCRADDFLVLAGRRPGRYVLAVTDYDLYAGDLNFVFGMAQNPGKAAVISLHRLRWGADEAAFRARAVKEAIHELGHALGLGHCRTPTCVMRFSDSLADTDRKGPMMCPACRRKLWAAASEGNPAGDR